MIPIYWLKELETKQPLHTLQHFVADLWDLLQSRTTLSLLIFVIGNAGLTNFSPKVNYYLQYYILELTNFETGIDGMTTYISLVFAIWIFKTYLINRNWRCVRFVLDFGSCFL